MPYPDPPPRDEHLAWCKQRALAYVEAGDLLQAFGSMVSDLGKHPETAAHQGLELGMMLALAGKLGTAEELRDWIEGFN